MGKAGCLLNLAALLVGCLVGLVTKVDIYGVVKKKGRLHVLDCKLCSDDIFLFRVLVHCRYLEELYPSYPMIPLLGTVVCIS